MWRTLLILMVVPAAALLGWLALHDDDPRADFVFTTSEPRTLDPHRASWLQEIQLAAAMFEGLTRLNAVDFQPEPAVARDWSVDPGQTVYTFRLRPDARWSNGDPVTAEDFRWSWLRVLEPATESQYATLMWTVRGAEDYYRSRLNADPADDLPANQVGIAVLDPHTLLVNLARPCPYFTDLTSFPTFAPVHRPTIEQWTHVDGRPRRERQHLWLRPGRMVGNGAFVLDDWRFKQRIRLRRNPAYWDAAGIRCETIEALIIVDPNAGLVAYETGRADLVSFLERSVTEVLLAEQRAGRRSDFHSGDRLATFFYRVNCRRPPLDQPSFRQALSLAIDREALCTHILRLGETAAYTLVPRPTLPLMPRKTPDGRTVLYSPPDGLGAGLEAAGREEMARKLLRAAGVDDPAAVRPIEIAFPPEPEQRLLAEAIQAMWERVLGLRIELRTVEGKVLSSRIREFSYDLARSDWFGDYMDPATFLELFTTGSGQNRTGWSNADYDGLIAMAAGEAENERRYGFLSAAEQILCEQELPIIPVFYRRGNYLLSPRIGGVNDNVRNLLQIHRAVRGGD